MNWNFLLAFSVHDARENNQANFSNLPSLVPTSTSRSICHMLYCKSVGEYYFNFNVPRNILRGEAGVHTHKLLSPGVQWDDKYSMRLFSFFHQVLFNFIGHNGLLKTQHILDGFLLAKGF